MIPRFHILIKTNPKPPLIGTKIQTLLTSLTSTTLPTHILLIIPLNNSHMLIILIITITQLIDSIDPLFNSLWIVIFCYVNYPIVNMIFAILEILLSLFEC